MCLNRKDSTMKKTLFGMLVMGLTCYAQGGEVTVKLITETGRVLEDEYSWDIRVAVSNGTDSAIQVVEEGGYAKGTQVFLMLLPEYLMRNCIGGDRLKSPHTNSWENITTTNPWSTKRVCTLAPGQMHLWDYSELFLSIQLLAEELPKITDQFDVYAQVLVGTNLWAASSTNTVRFARQKIKDGNIIFTGTYRGIRTFDVYEHTTDGDCFLFCAYTRVCKVPAGATPSFEVEAGTDILKVTFSDNSPPVRFNIWEGKVIP